MRSGGPEAWVAAGLLAETEDGQLPLWDVSSGKGFPNVQGQDNAPIPHAYLGKTVATMNTPYGLEIIENCITCKLRRDKWFCGLSSDVLKAFSAASHLSTYPGGAILFVEGQTPRGGYVLCSGKVKLSAHLERARC
jgi:hypothetical protein